MSDIETKPLPTPNSNTIDITSQDLDRQIKERMNDALFGVQSSWEDGSIKSIQDRLKTVESIKENL
jgi:hypothetical protein